MESVECGAAALGIVLGYYGKYVPLEELRVACGVSRDGSKASYIVEAATQYGLNYKAYRKTLIEVQKLKGPFIVFWNFNHFLVIEGFTDKAVFLNDPSNGRRKISYEEFDESFTGVVIEFEPSIDFQPGGSPFSPQKSLNKWIKTGNKELMYLVYLGLLSIVPATVLPVFSKIFVDQVLIQHMTSWIFPILIVMLSFVGIKTIIEWIQLRLLKNLNVKLLTIYSSKFLIKILRLPSQFYLNRSATEVAGRISSIKDISNFITVDLATTFFSLFGVLFFSFVLFLYDIEMTLVTISLAIINFFMLSHFAKRRKGESQLLVQDEGKLMATTVNGLSMIETLKASGREEEFLRKWSGLQARVTNTTQKTAKISSYLNVLPQLLLALNLVVVLFWGGHKVMNGELTMGMLMAYTVFIQFFYQPIIALVRLASRVQELYGNLVRVDEILEKEEIDLKQKMVAEPIMDSSIEVKNMCFGFNIMQEPLFNNLNLNIQRGQKIAIVGPSGSGKSTLAKILSGIFTPWSGEIVYGGQSLDAISQKTLSNELAVVDQEIFIFQGRIKDVLTLWDTTVSEKDMIAACKDACIHEDIVERPNGYYEYLSEGGSNFSGGQRQRMEIARALIRNPRFLIMDEATSALDPNTEKEIDLNLKKRGCTTIFIAHRLSTIRDCDEIIVLDHGKIVERGTHEQLVKLDGMYACLVKTDG